MKHLLRSIGAMITILLLAACNTKNLELTSPALAEYFPLEVGRQLTYRLDSTVTTAFGADTTVRHYRVRDRVDARVTDALGRPAFRVFRTISDSSGKQPYQSNNTFMSVAQGTDWIEHIENNLRFMKLRFPIQEDFQWKGNSFINASIFSASSPVRYLANWEYQYQNVGQPFTVNGRRFENTVTILQRDEVFPEGPFDRRLIKQWDYSVEVYAKGVGLIYKNFDHKVWQPPTPAPDPRPGYWEDGSYRVVLKLIDF
jgi:hypothetical protein